MTIEVNVVRSNCGCKELTGERGRDGKYMACQEHMATVLRWHGHTKEVKGGGVNKYACYIKGNAGKNVSEGC